MGMIERYQNNPPRIIEPAFCLDDGLWFVDDPVEGVTTAPTLRQLLRKFPGAVIEGYYPEGFEFKRPKEDKEFLRAAFRGTQATNSTIARRKDPTPVPDDPAPMVSELDTPAAEFKPVEQLKVKKKRKRRAAWEIPDGEKKEVHVFPKVDWKAWDARLQDMVKDGKSCGQIANVIGCNPNAVVGRCWRKGYKLNSQG
jgi:hypothetical protein